LLISYGQPSRFEALHWFIDALRIVNPDFEGLPASPPPLEFQVSDPEVMRQRLMAVGLRQVTVDTTHQEKIELRSARQLWDWCLGGNPIPGMLVAELTDAQKASVRARIDEMI